MAMYTIKGILHFPFTAYNTTAATKEAAESAILAMTTAQLVALINTSLARGEVGVFFTRDQLGVTGPTGPQP